MDEYRPRTADGPPGGSFASQGEHAPTPKVNANLCTNYVQVVARFKSDSTRAQAFDRASPPTVGAAPPPRRAAPTVDDTLPPQVEAPSRPAPKPKAAARRSHHTGAPSIQEGAIGFFTCPRSRLARPCRSTVCPSFLFVPGLNPVCE